MRSDTASDCLECDGSGSKGGYDPDIGGGAPMMMLLLLDDAAWVRAYGGNRPRYTLPDMHWRRCGAHWVGIIASAVEANATCQSGTDVDDEWCQQSHVAWPSMALFASGALSQDYTDCLCRWWRGDTYRLMAIDSDGEEVELVEEDTIEKWGRRHHAVRLWEMTCLWLSIGCLESSKYQSKAEKRSLFVWLSLCLCILIPMFSISNFRV